MVRRSVCIESQDCVFLVLFSSRKRKFSRNFCWFSVAVSDADVHSVLGCVVCLPLILVEPSRVPNNGDELRFLFVHLPKKTRRVVLYWSCDRQSCLFATRATAKGILILYSTPVDFVVMDWRASLQSSLKATEDNLNRMHATTHRSDYNSGKKADHGASTYTSNFSHQRRSPFTAPLQSTHAHTGSIDTRQHFHEVRSPRNSPVNHAGRWSPNRGQEGGSSAGPPFEAMRVLTSEIGLERQIREDTVRELSRRTSHEVAELREMIRQLREDNQNMKDSFQGLESTVRRQRNATSEGSPGKGGGGSHIALLPRVADLEAVVQRQQRIIEERGLRWNESIQDAIHSRVEAEVEKMRTVSREAARDATDAYVALRTDAMKESFERHTAQAEEGYRKASEAARTLDTVLQSVRHQLDAQLARLEERVDAALQGKDQWMRVSSDIHEAVRSQLEHERTRLEETIQSLRSEVTAAANKQSAEAVDAQHSLRHFVNQRLDSITSHVMSREEAARMLHSATTQVEEETGSTRRLLNAYKTQADDARADLKKFLQDSEGKIASIRAAVDELIVTRQADSEAVARVRSLLDDFHPKFNNIFLRVDSVAEKHATLSSQLDLLESSCKDHRREGKHQIDCLEAKVDHIKQGSLEQASEVVKLHNAIHRVDHALAAQREDLSSLQKRVDCIPQEISPAVKKQVQLVAAESERAMVIRVEELIADGQRHASSSSVRGAVVEEVSKAVIDRLGSSQDELLRKSIAATASTIMTDVMARVEDQMSLFQQQQQGRHTTLAEQSKRTVDNAVNAAKGDIEHTVELRIDNAVSKTVRDVHATLKESAMVLREELRASIDDSAQASRQETMATLRELQRRQVELERDYKHANELVAVEAANMKRAALDECRAALADAKSASETQWSSFQDSLVQRVDRLAAMVKDGMSVLPPRIADGVHAEVSANQRDEDLVHRVRQQVLLDIEQRVQDVSASTARRIHEVATQSSQNVARIQGLVNDLDERVSSLALSGASRGEPNGASTTAMPSSAAALQLRQWLHDVELRLQHDWKQSLDASNTRVQEQLVSLAVEVNKGIAELQEQMEEQISSVHAAARHSSSSAVSSSSPRRLDEEVTSGIVDEVERRVMQAVRDAVEVLDQQTESSLESLDSKLNALAEALSTRDEEREAKLRHCVHDCLATLRDASGSSNINTNASTSTVHADLSVSRPPHYVPSQLNDASDGAPSSAIVDVHHLLPMLTHKVIHCNEALQAISSSLLDTVDLVQRHEVGFASMNELVQAIVFNSQNIVTLAAAVGLDKEAFSLRLNYAEMGGPDGGSADEGAVDSV